MCGRFTQRFSWQQVHDYMNLLDEPVAGKPAFRSLPLVLFGAMKKYLPALAVLALAGCAHSQYRTTYLEEYAGHDCIELQAERLTVEAELDPRWRQGDSSRNAADSV